jgi:hypothetical protein
MNEVFGFSAFGMGNADCNSEFVRDNSGSLGKTISSFDLPVGETIRGNAAGVGLWVEKGFMRLA